MTTTEDPRTGGRATIRDPAVLRALAHPARLSLLQHLSRHPDGRTATECAGVVGLSPSATSYHLRALAKIGMIHEAPSRGDGRERRWRISHEGFELGTDADVSDEEMAAQTALLETFLARQNDTVLRFLAMSRDRPDWLQHSTVADRTLVMTADELKRLMEQIDELTAPYSVRNRTDPPKDSQLVAFQLRAVPTELD